MLLTGRKELDVFIGEWVTQLCLIFSSYIFLSQFDQIFCRASLVAQW